MSDMDKGWRLLFLLPFAPRLDATHGGGRVIGQFLAEMVTRHTVAILYLRSKEEPPLDEYFREHCARTEEVIRPTLGRSLAQRFVRFAQIVRALLHRKPIWVSDWFSQDFDQRCREVVQQFQPELVQVDFHVMGQYLEALHGYPAPRVLREAEAGVRAAPYLQVGPAFFRQAVAALEKHAWKRYERGIIRHVQAVITFTESDRAALQPIASGTPLYCVPPGTILPTEPLNPLGEIPPGLLFIGSFLHPANVEAALRLVKSIFPAVHKRFSEARLTVVGEAPPIEIQQAASPQISVTGKVPDVTPYLDRAAVFVAPVWSGGGIRIKVLEALGAGKAVVATPLAAEGLNLVNGREILLAESDDELAERIIELLADPRKRSELGKRARSWACNHLQWGPSIQSYETIYAGLLKDGAG